MNKVPDQAGQYSPDPHHWSLGKECRKFTKAVNARAVCVYGGTGISEQIAELKRGEFLIIHRHFFGIHFFMSVYVFRCQLEGSADHAFI